MTNLSWLLKLFVFRNWLDFSDNEETKYRESSPQPMDRSLKKGHILPDAWLEATSLQTLLSAGPMAVVW